MKNLSKVVVLIVAILTSSLFVNAQGLNKGNLLGLHSGKLTLAANVTMKQFVDHFKVKLKPVLEKEFQCKVFMIQGVRGKNAKHVGFIWLFDSDASRNKIYKSENVYTEYGKNAMKNSQAAIDSWYKLGKIESDYTDWEVL